VKKLYFIILLLAGSLFSLAQSNISVSNQLVLPLLQGNYDPSAYTPPVMINHPDSVLYGIVNRCSEDTLVDYLTKIDACHNRNTGSDTVSAIHGIGAARPLHLRAVRD